MLTSAVSVSMATMLLFIRMLVFLLLNFGSVASAGTEVTTEPCPENWVDASPAGIGCLSFNSSARISWMAANKLCTLFPRRDKKGLR